MSDSDDIKTQQVKDEIHSLLSTLTKEEQTLLSEVVRLERENLHDKSKTRAKTLVNDCLKKVEVIFK